MSRGQSLPARSLPPTHPLNSNYGVADSWVWAVTWHHNSLSRDVITHVTSSLQITPRLQRRVTVGCYSVIRRLIQIKSCWPPFVVLIHQTLRLQKKTHFVGWHYHYCEQGPQKCNICARHIIHVFDMRICLEFITVFLWWCLGFNHRLLVCFN